MSVSNPYEAPKSPVLDVEQAASTRPWTVGCALVLIALGSAVVIIETAVSTVRVLGAQLAEHIGELAVTCMFLVVFGFVIFKIAAGIRWARVVGSILVILFIQELARAMWRTPGLLDMNRVVAALTLLILSAAVVLLFLPASNRWFSTKK